jgi:hypothetical protein
MVPEDLYWDVCPRAWKDAEISSALIIPVTLQPPLDVMMSFFPVIWSG